MEDRKSVRELLNRSVREFLHRCMNDFNMRTSFALKIRSFITFILRVYIVFLSFASAGIYPVDVFNVVTANGISGITEKFTLQNIGAIMTVLSTFIVLSAWSFIMKNTMLNIVKNRSDSVSVYIRIFFAVACVFFKLLPLGIAGFFYEIGYFTILFISAVLSEMLFEYFDSSSRLLEILGSLSISEDDIDRYLKEHIFIREPFVLRFHEQDVPQ